ncbi:hypothetical protein [Mesorhizobium neociceri]|uniref:Uncharacterized protein n=1 Tax=Mesorhizobium neociceri TaxID=1307853 RepID=A0A838B5N4_9HYPH|nr:hypothetical protein [Mesorhizobium neociceri]MBA1141397.1 hypothetical protein [Mesorhizobium neociceri]
MDLNYDFEMQSIFPKAAWLVPECKELLDGQGIAHNMKGNYVAAFVDPATAVALWQETADFRSSFIKADWSTLPYEGEADAGKAHFLIPKSMEIHAKAASGAYSAEAVRYAVYDLHLFTRKLTMGEILDANGKPTCSDLTRQRMSNARPASKFDANKAVMAMASDPRNHRAHEKTTVQASPAKPTEAGLGLFGRAARAFGRKTN